MESPFQRRGFRNTDVLFLEGVGRCLIFLRGGARCQILQRPIFQLNFGAMKNLSTEFGMTFTLGDQVQKACQDVLLVIL